MLSLIYLGIQVNDSTRTVRAAAANDANVSMQNWHIAVGTNPQSSEIMITGRRGTGDSTPAEEYQFLMMMHGIFLGMQNRYLLVDGGTPDPLVSETITAAITGVKELPGLQGLLAPAEESAVSRVCRLRGTADIGSELHAGRPLSGNQGRAGFR